MSLILKYDLGNPHRLPVGYTPLAYIESTGTLRIDTNIVMNSNIRINAKIEIKEGPGILWGTNSIGDLSSWAAASGYNWRYGGLPVAPNYTPVGVHHVILDSNFVKIDGLTYNYSGTFAFNSLNIQIFSVASGNSNGNAKYKLYFFKLIKNNQLIRDFIPAKNSSGVVGLFDCVSQTFFTNQGTGSFIAGPEVVVLPYEYLLVEYLESEDNINCYINTSFIPDNNTRLITSIYPTSTRSYAHFFFGSRTGSSTNQAFGVYQSGPNTAGIYGLWNTSGNVSVGIGGLKWYNIDFDKNVLKINGSTTYTFSSGTFTGTYPIFLFAINTSGGMDGLKGGLKLGITKIYNNGTISRNMIPCYRRSDLKPGMYDTVNNVFYTNSGSGEFILGPVVEESSRLLEYNQVYTSYENPGKLRLPSTYQEVQYLQSSGTLWINTTYPYNSTNTTYRVLCKFLMVSVNTNWLGVYGAYLGEDYNAFRLLRGNSNTSFLFTTNARAGANNNRVEVNSIFNEFIVDHSYSKYELTDLTTNNTYTNSSPVHGNGTDCTSTFYVFSQASSSCLAPEKIFYFKLYDNNQLRVHLIPCYRKSDSKPGMYDLVTNTFLTNAGSGEFTLGPNVLDTVGLPINIHHSTSNPSSTLINLGSGEFDGTSSIIIADSPSTNVRSASFWMNINNLNDTYLVPFIDYKSRLCFGRNNNTGNTYLSATPSINTYPFHFSLNTNTWYHVVVINTGSSNTATDRQLYINGIQLTQNTSETVSYYNSGEENKLNIGLRKNSSSSTIGINGKIYDFRLYDHALTADEVLKIYKGGL